MVYVEFPEDSSRFLPILLAMNVPLSHQSLLFVRLEEDKGAWVKLLCCYIMLSTTRSSDLKPEQKCLWVFLNLISLCLCLCLCLCVVVSFKVSLHPAYGNDWCKVQRGFVRYIWNYKHM